MTYQHQCFTQQSLFSSMLTPHIQDKSEDAISRHLCTSRVFMHFEYAWLIYGMSGLFRLQVRVAVNLLSETRLMNISQKGR